MDSSECVCQSFAETKFMSESMSRNGIDWANTNGLAGLRAVRTGNRTRNSYANGCNLRKNQFTLHLTLYVFDEPEHIKSP
jgi:hypothetical protein